MDGHCRRLQSQHQQQLTSQKPSFDHHLSSGQVGGVSGGGAWPADRDVSDSDDDDGAEICVVDDDDMANNDECDNNSQHHGVVSPQRTASLAEYHTKSAYNQQISPSRSSADIYPPHKSQGLYYYYYYYH